MIQYGWRCRQKWNHQLQCLKIDIFYLKYVILKGAGKVCWNIWFSTPRMMIQNWLRRGEIKLLKVVSVLYSMSGLVSVSSHVMTDRCSDCSHHLQNWYPCVCQQRIKLGANHPSPPSLCWQLNCCRQIRDADAVAVYVLWLCGGLHFPKLLT